MEITYKYYSSFEMNEKEKNDFIKVFNKVFNENWTKYNCQPFFHSYNHIFVREN